VSEIPHKLFYKIGEVCQYTDTQPYVLRFWETEFPNLAPEKNRSGQRVYRQEDIALIFRIKKLLYEEEYTIAGARKRLEQERLGTVDGSWTEERNPGRIQERRQGAHAVLEAETSDPGPEVKTLAEPFAGLIGETGAVEVRSGQYVPEIEEARSSPSVVKDAMAEVERLRQRLAVADESSKRAEELRAKSERSAEACRARCDRVAARLEEILFLLPGEPPDSQGHP